MPAIKTCISDLVFERGKIHFNCLTWLHIVLHRLTGTNQNPASNIPRNKQTISQVNPIMSWIVTKYLVTAAVVVFVSECAKRSDKLGALIAALPLVTVLTLIWLYVEKQPEAKLANHASYTFWYVIPTLPMFLVFPILLPRMGFWVTLGICILITFACFGLWALIARYFGVELM